MPIVNTSVSQTEPEFMNQQASVIKKKLTIAAEAYKLKKHKLVRQKTILFTVPIVIKNCLNIVLPWKALKFIDFFDIFMKVPGSIQVFKERYIKNVEKNTNKICFVRITGHETMITAQNYILDRAGLIECRIYKVCHNSIVENVLNIYIQSCFPTLLRRAISSSPGKTVLKKCLFWWQKM